MNAVLQVLAQTQDMVNFMVIESLREDSSRNKPGQGLKAEEVAQLSDAIWSKHFGVHHHVVSTLW